MPLYSIRHSVRLTRALFSSRLLPSHLAGVQSNARLFSSLSSFWSKPSRYTFKNPGLPTAIRRKIVTATPRIQHSGRKPQHVTAHSIRTARLFSSWLSSPPKPPPENVPDTNSCNKIQELKEKVKTQDIRKRDVLEELDEILDEQRVTNSNSRADLLQARLDESRRDKDKMAGSFYSSKGSKLVWLVLGGAIIYFLWGRVNKEENLFKDNFREIHPPGSVDTQLVRYKQKRVDLDLQKDQKISFADVKGNADAKEELRDLVDYLQDPSRYQEMGLDLPKRCITRWTSWDRKNSYGSRFGWRSWSSIYCC